MLIVNRHGIVIIEVKNHSGYIEGKYRDEELTQTKRYANGKIVTNKIPNPVWQVKRQRDILKNILLSHGYDVWVDGVVFFSNEKVKVTVNGAKRNTVFSDSGELMRFVLSNRNNGFPEMYSDEIIEIIRTLNE
jgi:hypothetical protein